jgi:hypothetical protein
MKRWSARLLVGLVILASAIPALAGSKPKLKGRVFAGVFQTSSGPATLYWVFHDNRFYEYIESPAGELQLLSSTKYKDGPSDRAGYKGKFVISLSEPSVNAAAAAGTPCGAATLQARPQTPSHGISASLYDQNGDGGDMGAYYNDQTLSVLDSIDLSAVQTEDQWAAEDMSNLGYMYNVSPQVWGGCCDLCWAVHDNLNGWRRNGIGNIDFHRFDRYCCGGGCNWYY